MSWDELLNDDSNNRWYQVATDIEEVVKIVMTCRYCYVLADANMKAYGTIAYLQSAGQVDFMMAT